MREKDEPLSGLARVIDETLKLHPDWFRNEDGRAACDGEDCQWVKPNGNGVSQQWRKHQKYVLMGAISDWYSEREDDKGNG